MFASVMAVHRDIQGRPRAALNTGCEVRGSRCELRIKKSREANHFFILRSHLEPRTSRFRGTHYYVPAGRPLGDGREMAIIAMRSFSSYQQWKRLMPGTWIW